MSFIYDDPNLLDALIKSALDYNRKFTKEGQAEDKDIKNVNLLISNLEKSFAPPKPGTVSKAPPGAPKVSFESDPDPAKKGLPQTKPGLTASNLETLGALVSFLATNRITVDGKRAAYHFNEESNIADKEDYHYYKLEPSGLVPGTPDRSRVIQAFFVNKDALVKFIQSRQAALSVKPNKVEEFYLGYLIAQANDFLNVNIDPKYKPPTVVIDPEDVVDLIPKPMSLTGTGLVELKFKDIQSVETLNDWLEANDMTILVNNVPVSTKDDKFDDCAMIKILYTRANTMRSTTKTEKIKAAYLAKIIEIAPKFKSKDGKACDIGAQKTTPGVSPAGAANQQRILQQITSVLPLDPEDIDFQRIRTFFDLFKQLLQGSDNPRASGIISDMNNAEQSISSAAGLMRGGAAPINLAQDPRGISNTLQQPSQIKYVPFLQHLQMLIDTITEVVDSFYAMYRASLTADQLSLVVAQTRGGSSYAVRNKEIISGLIADRAEVAKFV